MASQLGGTEFSNMHLAYEDLPSEIKGRLPQMTATHNFEKFWEHMRRNHGSERPAMTDEQRRRRPPVIHDSPKSADATGLIPPAVRSAETRRVWLDASAAVDQP